MARPTRRCHGCRCLVLLVCFFLVVFLPGNHAQEYMGA